MLSDTDKERYARQLLVPDFGTAAQERLAHARVLVAGAGGLGCAASLYLAAAGVGSLRIADCGRVELSNLNRQVLYGDGDVGRPKAEVAAERLRRLNPRVEILPACVTLDPVSIPPLLSECDLVLDALDNIPSRLALNEAAVSRGLPLVHGAAGGFSGQVMTVIPRQTACLMCLYRDGTAGGPVPVLGVAPGLVGVLQATAAITHLTGIGRKPAGVLLLVDGRQMSFTELRIARDPLCPHCGTGGAV